MPCILLASYTQLVIVLNLHTQLMSSKNVPGEYTEKLNMLILRAFFGVPSG